MFRPLHVMTPPLNFPRAGHSPRDPSSGHWNNSRTMQRMVVEYADRGRVVECAGAIDARPRRHIPNVSKTHAASPARTGYPRAGVHGRIVHAIGRRIVKGEIQPGEQLPTAARVRASRGVVREAVKVLAAKGLVVSRPKTGTRVRPRESWNLLDPDVLAWRQEGVPPGAFLGKLTEVRLLIEPGAAELAARRARPAQIAALQAARDMSDALICAAGLCGLNELTPLPRTIVQPATTRCRACGVVTRAARGVHAASASPAFPVLAAAAPAILDALGAPAQLRGGAMRLLYRTRSRDPEPLR